MATPQIRNIMQMVNKDLYCTPDDAMQFMSSIRSEPGMFGEYTLDPQGRLVDVYWCTAEQKEKCIRYGDCVQMDTTMHVCRSVACI